MFELAHQAIVESQASTQAGIYMIVCEPHCKVASPDNELGGTVFGTVLVRFWYG